MKNSTKINNILNDHEQRICKLESFLNQPKVTGAKKTKKHLSDYIIDLRDKSFFSQPKSAVETHKKLQERYHCELNRVEVALIRLANKRKLRKANKSMDNKKYKAYVW